MEKPTTDSEQVEQTHPSEPGHVPVAKTAGELHGRAIQQAEFERSYWQTLRRDPWLMLWIAIMLWSLGVRGFENQASSSVISIPVFKERFGEKQGDSWFISTQWQSALNGGGNAAAIIGSTVSSHFTDMIGAKPVLLAASLLNIASVAVEFSSTSIGMFFGGKMMNFVAIGALQNVCTTYIAEVSPLAIRASAIGFCNLAQCIGPFICAILSYYSAQWETQWAWRALICAQWGFGAVALCGQVFIPESPVFLVRKGRMEAARKSLGRMYTLPSDADGHLERIKYTLEEAGTKQSGRYIDCFRGPNLRRTLISILVFCSEPMAGLGFVGSYGALMYQYLGISSHRSFLLQIGAQILSMSGATFALFISDFIGRRPNYVIGCAALAALLLCMGISGSVTTAAATTASVGFYTMFNFFYNISVGSTVYTLAGELPTSALRAKSLAMSLNVSHAVNTMWSFVCPYIFNPDYGNLKAKIGFVFGGFMLIWAVLGYFWVPETRRRSYEELDELFMNHVPARQFRTYVTVAQRRAEEALCEEKKVIEGERA